MVIQHSINALRSSNDCKLTETKKKTSDRLKNDTRSEAHTHSHVDRRGKSVLSQIKSTMQDIYIYILYTYIKNKECTVKYVAQLQ
jgi:hypothetical protein